MLAVSREFRKHQFLQYICLGVFFPQILRVCPPERVISHATDVVHATLCGAAGYFKGEKRPLLEVAPPEQSQHNLRSPLAQPRPSAAPKNKPRPPPTQVFVAVHPGRPARNNYSSTSLRASIGVFQSLLPAWGSGAAPAHIRDSKSDNLPLTVASKKQMSPAATARRGRVPSLA